MYLWIKHPEKLDIEKRPKIIFYFILFSQFRMIRPFLHRVPVSFRISGVRLVTIGCSWFSDFVLLIIATYPTYMYISWRRAAPRRWRRAAAAVPWTTRSDASPRSSPWSTWRARVVPRRMSLWKMKCSAARRQSPATACDSSGGGGERISDVLWIYMFKMYIEYR